KMVFEAYRDQLSSRDPNVNKAMIRKLVAEADNPQNDLATRFALLQVAQKKHFEAYDLAGDFLIADKFGELFEVDDIGLKARILTTARIEPETQRLAAEFVQEAIQVDRTDEAAKAIRNLDAEARKAKNKSFSEAMSAL